jgi:hypothetical protein
MKNASRRIARLERKLLPVRRVFVVLGTPENQALVVQGFLPDPPQTRPALNAGGQRLGKRDLVIFVTEQELAL